MTSKLIAILALTTMAFSGVAHAKAADLGHGWTFDSFADVEGRLTDKDWVASRGFTLNDASFMLGKELGHGLSAMVDLPFYTTTAASNVNFGGLGSQAYFQYTSNAWQTKFGQWEPGFGYEANHSRDRFFANYGLMKGAFLPVTLTGVREQFSVNGFKVSAMITNADNRGSMVNDNPEAGIQARFDAANWYAGAAATMNDGKAATTDKSNNLIDVVAGLKLNKFAADVEYDNKHYAGSSDAGSGIGILGTFQLQDDLGLGFRYENLTKPVTANQPSISLGGQQLDSAWTAAVGANYQWMKEITLRGDVTFENFKPKTGDSASGFGLAFSLVATM